MLYILLCGYPPFFAETDREILEKVREGNLQFLDEEWRSVSADAKGLIKNMLCMDSSKRISADKALHDEWMTNAPQAKTIKLNAKMIKLCLRQIISLFMKLTKNCNKNLVKERIWIQLLFYV